MLDDNQIAQMDQDSGIYSGGKPGINAGGDTSSGGGGNPLSDIAGGASSFLRGMGLGAIPDAASAVTELPGEIGSMIKNGGINQNEANQTAGDYGKGDPFANPDTVSAVQSKNPNKIASAVSSETGEAAGGFNNAMADVAAPGIAEGIAGKLGLKGALSTARLMMKPGVAVRAQSAAARAGIDIPFSDLTSNVLGNVGNKQTPEFLSNVYNTLDRINPGSIKSGVENIPKGIPENFATVEPKLSVSDALDWRQQLDSEIPQEAWKDPKAASDEIKAKMAVRQEINNLIKTNAPDIATPDKALGAMAKMKGTIPQAIGKGAVKGAALWGVNKLGEKTGPLGQGALDALAFERLFK